jgi:DNA-binding PadR family transcriptional regulator
VPTTTPRPSPLGLTVLCLLQAGPLHPYGMQRLIRMWGKDQVVNVGQRANLYKTIKRLDEAGLVAVGHTEREQQYPERTVYEITDEGREVAVRWLTDMLTARRNGFPEFPAALSFAMLLGPAGLQDALERRAARARDDLGRLDQDLKQHPELPRITLLEFEYQRTTLAAEADWLDAVVNDLRSGALTWTRETLEAVVLH